jgi:hypoxanthine phosphoribosyltransferase
MSQAGIVPVQPFIDEATLMARVTEMGREIRRDHAGDTVHVVAVLKGAVMFLADLMRAIEGALTCDFIAVSSYAGKSSSGEVRLLKDLDYGLQGKSVIVVEDIVDTGLTLSYLLEILSARGPRSLRTACLLSKPSRRLVEVPVEYVGFTIEDRFVVGYGLDFDQQYRNLPYIGVLDGGAR